MAKNKKQDRRPSSERGQQEVQQPSMESAADQRVSTVTPGDMARKGRHKRFGHN